MSQLLTNEIRISWCSDAHVSYFVSGNYTIKIASRRNAVVSETFCDVVSSFITILNWAEALKMETVCFFSETLESTGESTWRQNPEEHHHITH
jgi:hypothetical protein